MAQPEVLAQKTQLRPLRLTSARRTFSVNAASNVAFSLTEMIVGMWFTPYLIGYLGIAAFGVISLANTLIGYMQILTDSFNAALTRFLIIDLNREDSRAANRTFNTALFGLLGAIVVLIPVALLVSLAFPRLFNVPSGFEREASWFFGVTALSFFIGVIASNFAISSYAQSRFVLRNGIGFVAMFARIGFVVLLFSFFPVRLWYVGLGFIIAAVIGLGGHSILWRKLTPELHIQFKAADLSQMRPLLGMGGWVIVNRVGQMLLKNVDLIVVNLTLGAVATGSYGVLLSIGRMPQTFLGTVTSVIEPIILRKYALGDITGLKQIALQSTKLIGLGLALPVGLVCGFSRPFLSIWLGPSFQNLSLVLIAVMSYLSVTLSIRPLMYIQTAYNKIRWPGLVTVAAGVLNVVLDLVFVWSGWGLLGVAMASVVAWTAKNLLYMPIYTAHIMKLRWYTFLPSLIVTAVSTCAVGLAAYGLTRAQMPTGWLSLGVSASIVSLVYALFVSLFALNRADWQLLKSILLKRA